MTSSFTASQQSADDPLIIRLLKSTQQLDPERLETLYDNPCKDGVSLEELITRSGLADERQIAQSYARHYLIPCFDPPQDSPLPIDPAIAQNLPEHLCRDHLIAPLSDDGTTLEVALVSPDSLLLAGEIKLLADRQMQPMFTTRSVVEQLISVLYQEQPECNAVACVGETSVEGAERAFDGRCDKEDCAKETGTVDFTPNAAAGDDGRTIGFIKRICEHALRTGASDVHIEPYEGSCRVRLRIGSVLSEMKPPPMPILNTVIQRLKTLGNMKITDQLLPQDGVIGLRRGDHRFDIRVSTCPTVFGEKVVMRLLEKKTLHHDLTKLGLDERQFQDLSTAIRSPQGMMLVTGPTGSGKSTTLYSCLNSLNQGQRNVCTVEDSVKQRVSGINQVQTCTKVGLTYSAAVRSFLRQDADVIMVGEVCDIETAEVCAGAALNGRFVLSALHANDALSSVARLQVMGIDRLTLSSILRILVGQRLLRRLCDECKTAEPVDRTLALRHGIDPKAVIFGPRGCSHCDHTGYQGRVAAFQVIRINGMLREMIRNGHTASELERAATGDGVSSLQQDAFRKVVAGETSLDEARRVCERSC